MTQKQKAKELIYNLGRENALYLSQEMQIVIKTLVDITGSSACKDSLKDWEGVERKISKNNKIWIE